MTAEHSTARRSKRKVPLLGCMHPFETVECELAELGLRIFSMSEGLGLDGLGLGAKDLQQGFIIMLQ